MSNFLFVYGKLKKRFTNQGAKILKQKSKFIGKAIVYGKMYNIGSYPGVILSVNKEDKVQGELFEISADDMLGKLDEFEEAYPLYSEDAEYKRIKTNALLDNTDIECQIYVYNRKTEMLEIIPSGNY